MELPAKRVKFSDSPYLSCQAAPRQAWATAFAAFVAIHAYGGIHIGLTIAQWHVVLDFLR